jgi:methylated-DNA-protein-cysteine methyltransferase-like protein
MSSASKSRGGAARSNSERPTGSAYGEPEPKTQNAGMLTVLRRVVARIPKGKVATYGAVAAAAGFPGAARQVAWALHNNSSGLPWHRVLGAGGRIRLAGESGMEQRMRLEQEGVSFSGSRVLMEQHEAVLKKVPRRPPGIQ